MIRCTLRSLPLLSVLALSCKHTEPTNQEATPAPSSATPPEPSPDLPPAEETAPVQEALTLNEVLGVDAPQMPTDMRQDWPPEAWTHARAYTYNFVPYSPGHTLRVWDERGWSDSIRSTLEITREQAEAALELTHRTLGDIRASKCAFPRHAVVFFNASDSPVASVNVCFECTDILIWPPYSSDEGAESAKYEHSTTVREGEDTIELPLVFSVHNDALDRWSQLFDLAGAESFEP